MKKPRRPPSSPDDEVVYIDSDGDEDLSTALAEAERAVAAASEKIRHAEEEAAAAAKQRHAGEEAPAEEARRPADEETRRPADEETAVAAPAAAAPSPSPGEPVSAEASTAEERLRELAAKLAVAEERLLDEQEESGRLREALLRKTADLENVKRRTEREKSEFFRFALVDVFSELLGVLDNFERALPHLLSGDAATGSDVHVGIEMISRQLGDVLRKYGLAEVAALGLPFDPNVHEAVVREETRDASPGTILEVLQKGYVLNDRLLRPAKVKVAALPAAGDVEN